MDIYVPGLIYPVILISGILDYTLCINIEVARM